MKLIREIPIDRWQAFVDTNPRGNIFHTPEMFEVFRRTKDHLPELWAVEENGEILALMVSVKVAVMGSFMGSLAARRVVYGGFLCHPTLDSSAALEYLLEAYAEKVKGDALFTEFRNQYDVSAFKPILESCGFHFEEHQNYLVDLNMPLDAVWHNLHEGARAKIGQAQRKKQLIIEAVESREQIPTWYALVQQTFAHAQVPLADISLFEAAYDCLAPVNRVRFLLGRVGDEYVAASASLLYKRCIYDWYRGFNRDYGKYRPNDLLVWDILEWGVNHGYATFDFGGAGRPNEEYGPRSFKSKFGGALVNYGRNVCIHSPLKYRLSRWGYQVARRLIR